MEPAADAVLLSAVRRTFGAAVAVDRLDLAVRPGEFYALLGPNGAGKTTTLRMIAGLLRPDAGTIRIFGIDALADPMAAKRITAWLPDEPMLYDKLSPLEYLELVAGLWGVPADIAARLGFAPQGARQLAQLLYVPGAWSQGRVIYPQLGGLGDTRASVMVVTQQMVGTDAGVRVFIRTLDVRLALEGGQWRFDSVQSDGGTQVLPSGPVSPEALSVLNDPRIEMPDSARWDILSGAIAPNLLRIMARLAERTPYGVTTLSQGHPYEVFGTDKQSDHTRGRAVDIYRLGDTLVIDDRAEGSMTYKTVQWLYDQPEIRQIGSPWALDGYGGKSFSDRLHQDHLHIAANP